MGKLVPQRIISLVPSLTELVLDLGLLNQLVGRTRFCIHPAETVKQIPIVGGTKNPDINKIINLKPDLIIANKEENRKEDIEILQQKFHVLITDISSIKEALLSIAKIGSFLGVEEKAQNILERIRFEQERSVTFKPANALYLIWHNPWMTIGGDTYIHDVLQHWGLRNIYGDQLRYPEVNLHHLKTPRPDLILLSSEPFPFKEKHAKEIRHIFSEITIYFVDGEWFSWYGSRMELSFKKLNEWRKNVNL